MSVYITGLALRCRLGNPYRKLLLVYLANVSTEEGRVAEASISYLERGLEIGRSSIRKYRAELAEREPADPPEAVRFGLVSWNGEAGRGGSTSYRINVARLEEIASQSWRTPAPEKVRAAEVCPANGSPGGYLETGKGPSGGPFTGEKVRPADTILSNYHSTESGAADLFSVSFLDRSETRSYAPDYVLHPAVIAYCEAFKTPAERLQVYHRELIAAAVEISEPSLAAWNRTLEDYRARADWNPGALNNLVDRYKRYATGKLGIDTAGDGSGMACPTETPTGKKPRGVSRREGGRRGDRKETPAPDYLRRLGYD